MARLPDVSLGAWLEDQRRQFQEKTAGLFPALEFGQAIQENNAAIPPDYDMPGGQDQWEEAERKRIEEEARAQQAAAEQRRREQESLERQQLEESYRQQQAASEAQQTQQVEREAGILSAIQARGIPTPDDFRASLGIGTGATSLTPTSAPAPRPVNNTSTSGVFDSREIDAGPHEFQPPALTPVEQFRAHADSRMNEQFPPPPTDPTPDNASTSGVFDSYPENPHLPSERAISVMSEALQAGKKSAYETYYGKDDDQIDQIVRTIIRTASPTISAIQVVQDASSAFGAVVGRRVAESLGVSTDKIRGSEDLIEGGYTGQDIAGQVGSLVLDPTNLVPAGQGL